MEQCGAVCVGGVREGTMLLAGLLEAFSVFSHYQQETPIIKLGPSCAGFRVGGYVLGPYESLQETLL